MKSQTALKCCSVYMAIYIEISLRQPNLQGGPQKVHLNTSGITSHGTDSFHVKPITPVILFPRSQPTWLLSEGVPERQSCENNPQSREDIIRKEIRRIAQEILNRFVDNFIVPVAAVLSYSSVVHGTNIVLITEKYSKSLLILEWFTSEEFYKLPVSVEKNFWRFPYFHKSYCQRKIGIFLWATLYTEILLWQLCKQ